MCSLVEIYRRGRHEIFIVPRAVFVNREVWFLIYISQNTASCYNYYMQPQEQKPQETAPQSQPEQPSADWQQPATPVAADATMSAQQVPPIQAPAPPPVQPEPQQPQPQPEQFSPVQPVTPEPGMQPEAQDAQSIASPDEVNTDAVSPDQADETEGDEYTGDEGLVRWQATEHIHREKTALWYGIFGLIVLVLIALAIFLVQSWTSQSSFPLWLRPSSSMHAARPLSSTTR